MREYPSDSADFGIHRPASKIVCCNTENGMNRVRAAFFAHYPHLGIQPSDLPIFAPDIQILPQYTVPPNEQH